MVIDSQTYYLLYGAPELPGNWGHLTSKTYIIIYLPLWLGCAGKFKSNQSVKIEHQFLIRKLRRSNINQTTRNHQSIHSRPVTNYIQVSINSEGSSFNYYLERPDRPDPKPPRLRVLIPVLPKPRSIVVVVMFWLSWAELLGPQIFFVT